jgi:hypothetical protein
MRAIAITTAIFLSSAICTPTQAQKPDADGYTYFHRVGATLAQQRADLDLCMPAVQAMTQPYVSSPYAYTMASQYGLGGVIGAAAAEDQARRLAQERAMPGNYENCMVTRGWSVVRLDEQIGRELARLNTRALSERLTTMVGAETPQGEVTREFGNEFYVRNGWNLPSLSLQVLPEGHLEIFQYQRRPAIGAMTSEIHRARAQERRDRQAAARLQRAEFMGSEEGRARQVSAMEVASLSNDATLLLVRAAGAEGRPVFVRADATEGSGPDSILVSPTTDIQIYAVTPGRWRLTTFDDQGSFSYCLGAPSIEIGAGEVVFAGTFMPNVATPDMTLDDARAALAAAPTLSERVRAASYVNGDTFACGGGASSIYAHDIPGAPFREGQAPRVIVAPRTPDPHSHLPGAELPADHKPVQ